MMTVEDDLGIDDECPNEFLSDIGNNCLAIYSPENKSQGTGFIINNDGIFLSAGHVFKNTSVEHYAYYGNARYDYKIIDVEYTQNEDYPTEESCCRDLFVGKLLDFHGRIDTSFHLTESSSLNIGSPLYAMGYSQRICHQRKEQTVDNTTLYLCRIPVILCSPDRIIRENKGYEIDVRLGMKNVRTIWFDNMDRFHGLSGGPVFRDKEIYGVFLGDLFVTSEYIMEKLRKI